MTKYRKKPVVIEAMQWTGDNLFEIVSFMDETAPDLSSNIAQDRWDDYCYLVGLEGLKIHTLEGTMKADVGDFIIRW